MAYEIVWRLEGRVILLRLWDVLSVIEALEIGEKVFEFFQQGSPPVHLVVNMTGLKMSPSGIQTNLRLTNALKHPHLEWLVTIGGTPLTQLITRLVNQVIRFKLYQSESLEIALEFLRKQDNSLAPLI